MGDVISKMKNTIGKMFKLIGQRSILFRFVELTKRKNQTSLSKKLKLLMIENIQAKMNQHTRKQKSKST